MNTLPVIAGVEITTDDQGRFNLNALEKAAKQQGVTKDIRPNEWFALQSVQEMTDILITENPAFNPIVSKPGRYGGTFAHELLAISYAGWVNAKFQLQVNQTFLDYKAGKLAETKPQLPDFNDPAAAARAWADQFEQTKLANEKLEVADHEIQRLQGVCHTIAAQFTPGMTIPSFCRQLNGVNIQKVQSHLAGRGMLLKYKGNRFKSASYYRDHYFTEKPYEYERSDGSKGIKIDVVLTKKGAVAVYKLYLKGDLPMKANWDGSHTHCLFDDNQ